MRIKLYNLLLAKFFKTLVRNSKQIIFFKLSKWLYEQFKKTVLITRVTVMYWKCNTIVESAVSYVVVARDQRTLTRDVEFCDKHRKCDADDLSPSQFRVFYILTCHFTEMSFNFFKPVRWWTYMWTVYFEFV